MQILYRLVFLLGALFLLASPIFSQQQYTGFSSDNFGGYATSYSNPATIANTLFKANVSSSFANLTTSNHIGPNSSLISIAYENEQERYRNHSSAGYNMQNTSIDLIGGYYELDHTHSIGYSFRFRTFGNLDGLPSDLTEAMANDYDSTKLLNTPINFEALNLSLFAYNEHRFQYARVLMDDGENFLKAGAALKLLNGMDATYLHAREGSFQFLNQFGSQSDFTGVEFQYGRAEKENSFSSRKLGFGFDLGVVYEYRPNRREYLYDMDGEKDIERYDRNKYLFKIGASIVDIGRVRFTKDSLSFDFTNDGDVMDPDNFSSALSDPVLVSFAQFDNYAQQGIKSGDNEEQFNMNLPTRFNLQVDYRFRDNIYFNFTSAIPLKLKNDPHKVHFKAIHTVTPRYETPKMSVMLPLTFQRNAQINLGVAFRRQFGDNFSFFIGSSNITGFLGKRAAFTRNLFSGITYAIPYTIPKDTDGDKISDAIDKCDYDPGPLSLQGCPDTDKDGIIDIEDHCIFDQGTKKFKGCPDRDNDGVIDFNDMCPDVPGLAIHYGCPDSDRDGVVDAADQCPDVPGIELNNGCPFEMPVCCADMDGDGVPNDFDKCPDVQGSPYNYGCPTDMDNVDPVDYKKQREELDPNHTQTKVEELKEQAEERPEVNITDDQMEEISFTDKAANRVTSISVYFDIDDASLSPQDDERIKKLVADYGDDHIYWVVGHTDGDGTEDYNLILSKKRSETVMRKLMTYDISYDNIDVMYYGEWKPLFKNTDTESKRKNRRVEIIVKKK